MGELREELVEFLLPLIQLTTPSIVDTKERHDAVDDQKPVLIANEELCDFVQELHLVLRIDSASVRDVVLCYEVSIQTSKRK